MFNGTRATACGLLMSLCACGVAAESPLASQYGYADEPTITTAGPPPTQPPDPASIASSAATAGDTSTPAQPDGATAEPVNLSTGTAETAPEPTDGLYARLLQMRLNEIFAGTSMLSLTIDGQVGGLTQQMVCVARTSLGLVPSTGYLVAGGTDEAAIMSATDIGIPPNAPTDADHWIIIDKTCQVLWAGERDVLIDVYPTSTGAPGYETEDGSFDAFRFDPALDTEGWHDSTAYPAAIDAPNSGNMYKPIYFNGGEAIHGAAYIPPSPHSKGCARTFPAHQDRILEWLGIDGLDDVTWKTEVIGLKVVVSGDYLTPSGEQLPEPEEIIPPLYDQRPDDTAPSGDGSQ